MFLIISLGAIGERAPQGFAPIAIGLGLTLIHLVSIPVTNTSVNPARSTVVALFVAGSEGGQLDNFGPSGWHRLLAHCLAPSLVQSTELNWRRDRADLYPAEELRTRADVIGPMSLAPSTVAQIAPRLSVGALGSIASDC